MFLGNWFLAAPHESCEEACYNNGLVCSDDQLRLHDSDVDTSTKLIHVLGDIDVWVGTKPCLDSNEAGPDFQDEDFPLINTGLDWKCYFSRPDRPFNKYNCMRQPTRTSTNNNKRRLCYCVKQNGE